jgi:hypothetical protein
LPDEERPASPRRFPIQKTGTLPAGSVPLVLAETAYRGYASEHGRQQSIERLAERGGFCWAEFGYYFAKGNER